MALDRHPRRASYGRGPRLQGYGVAAAATLLALLLQFLLMPLFGTDPDASPFMMFFAAVMVGAYFGGLGPGLLATALSSVFSWYFFLAPQYSFQILGAGQGLRLVVFVLEGVVISLLVEAMHSARRSAEEDRRTLRESEERYRLLVESAEDFAIFMLDPKGRITNWNVGAERLFGYREDEILGRDGALLFTPEDARSGEPERECRKALAEGRAENERWHLRKDGARFWGSGFVRPVRYGDLRGFSKVVRDDTERKQTQERLRESEERFRATFEQAAVGVAHVRPDGRLLRVNDKLCEILGYTREELLSLTMEEISYPADYDADLEQVRRVLSGEIGAYSMEKRYVRKDGSQVWTNLAVSLVRAPSGEPEYFIGAVEDITERKEAEEALIEIREAERKRIARDLHDGALQDLTYALAEAQIVKMLSEDSEMDERIDRQIEALKRASQRLREAVYDLRQEGASQGSFIRSVEALVELNRRMNPGCEVRVTVDDGTPQELPEKLGKQVLRVLQEALNNARKHSGAENVRVSFGTEENELLAVEVNDDGRGFAPGTPTGIGLRSMRERAEALGGELEVESEPGKGTRVRLRVPIGRLPKRGFEDWSDVRNFDGGPSYKEGRPGWPPSSPLL